MVLEKRFLIIAAAGMSAALSFHGHPAFADDNGSSTQAAMIQAEAQAEVAKSTAAAAAALASLAEGPVHPMVVNTPANVTVATPAAPATKLPPIDYSKLPPDLARPVTIKWNGPVDGATLVFAGTCFLSSKTCSCRCSVKSKLARLSVDTSWM
jgi:hypothetical protein